MLSITWEREPEAAWMPGYIRWIRGLDNLVEAIIRNRMDEIVEWMKENAIWMDRTSDARTSLTAELAGELGKHVLTLRYGDMIFYDVYLEYDHQGRFAILEPALSFWAPIILQDLQAALR